MKCLACGVFKEIAAKELYPYPDDGVVSDEPIEPLFVLDCQGTEWRVVIVCHQCLHRLDPDLWISDRCWAALNPITPFERLPLPATQDSARFRVESYAK
jgi:hypothetical protein